MSAPAASELDLHRARDLAGRARHVWYRRVGLTLMLAIVVAALLGAFGQRPETRTAEGEAAELSLRMPSDARGGLLLPVEITVTARQRIVAPQLVLGGGFIDGVQLNSLVPAATSETSRQADEDGRSDAIALTYPTLEAGRRLSVRIQLQIDATTIGDQDMSVAIEGAGIDPVRLPATMNVWP